ncbi:hypothetical protein H671_1g0947 [Cricetulus griseus]|nr:hypothetical protein H671_1g0947 [Cricetulus griseus]
MSERKEGRGKGKGKKKDRGSRGKPAPGEGNPSPGICLLPIRDLILPQVLQSAFDRVHSDGHPPGMDVHDEHYHRYDVQFRVLPLFL